MNARNLVILTLTAIGCSSPSEPTPHPDTDGSVDAGRDVPESTADAGPDANPDATTPPPFEFGFDPVPFDSTLTGTHPATVVFEGDTHTGTFFFLDDGLGAVGTLTFTADTRTHSYRTQGIIAPTGALQLTFTERSCSEGGDDCGDVPDVLRTAMVYDATGRHDGTDVVFAPFEVRPTARDLAEGFAFRPPAPIMTPNDGFKPADIPDPAASWNGRVSFIPNGFALSGDRPCNVLIEQLGADFQLTSMSCGGTDFVLGADPGPDPATLVVDTTTYEVEFDFVQGGETWTFAGIVDVGSFGGIVVRADRYDLLGSPTNATAADIDGLFFFENRP